MRTDITLAAQLRQELGKNQARRLRAGGLVPAILYGAGGQAAPVTVNPKEITRILLSKTGHNTIFNLDVAGLENTPVMIVDWQHHPTKGDLLHADLQRIDLNKRLSVKIPVHTDGDPKGVKQQGGLLEIVTREIEVECLPDEIPEHFVVDVRPLFIGQNLRASDVTLTGTMALKSPPDAVFCHVIALRTSEVTAAPVEEAVAAEAAEPEVIKKGKKEEEGEEESKKKK